MDVEIWKQVKVCFGKDLVMDTVSIVSTSSSILHISQSTVSAIANTAGWGWCHGQLWSHGSKTCLAVETWLEIVSKIAWILHLNGQTQLWISPTSRFEFAELSATCPTSSLRLYWLWNGILRTVWPQTLEIKNMCLNLGTIGPSIFDSSTCSSTMFGQGCNEILRPSEETQVTLGGDTDKQESFWFSYGVSSEVT